MSLEYAHTRNYDPYYALGYIAKNIDYSQLIIQFVIDEPRIFREITKEFIDRILLYTEGKLNIDHIIYASVNNPLIFSKVINAIKLTDNLMYSEYYEWFLQDELVNIQSYTYFISNLPDGDDRKVSEERFIYQNILFEMRYVPNSSDNYKLFTDKYKYFDL